MLNNADDTITNPVESRLGAFWTWEPWRLLSASVSESISSLY